MRRSFELGDVPTPQLARSRRQQLGARIDRVPELIPALAHLVVLPQDAVHRAPRAEVDALVEQGGVHLTWGLVCEARAVQRRPHGVRFGGRERTGRRRPRGRDDGGDHRLAPPIEAAPGDADGRTQGRPPERGGGRIHQVVDHCSIGGRPSSSANFFWISMMPSAWASLRVSWAFSRCKRAISSSCGVRVGMGPDGRAVSAWSWP